jgi:hypothetical protein
MLRITSTRMGSRRALRLEGRLRKANLPSLDHALIDGTADAEVTLDLEGLSWIDEAAAVRLRTLLARGAHLERCSPFVAELLLRRT